MDFFDGRNYKIIKFFLSVLGQWPFQTNRKRKITTVIIFLLYGTHFMAKLAATLSSYNNMNVIMNDLAPIMADIMGTIKLFTSMQNSEKMKKLLIKIESDYASFTLDEEIKIVQSYAEDAKKVSVICTGIYFCSLLFFLAPPLMPILSYKGTGDPVFVHHTEYFVDPLNYYYLIIFHSYITIFIIMCILIASDSIFVVITQHVCGLFTTIGYRLCNLTSDVEKLDNGNPSMKEDEYFKNISICIRRHQEAIEFVDIMKSYYSTSFFLEIGIIVAGISITACQALVTQENNNFFQQISVFYTGIGHILYECVNGQRIINHSSRIHEYLIETKWYQTPLRMRKMLSFMVHRSQYPCSLTAAGMIDLSMETFGDIIRTAISYFTVLRSTQ